MIHLICTEDGADKFWEASVEGKALTVRFGKRGTTGQTQVKTLASPAAAEKELAKLIAEKRRKGYRDEAAPAPAPAPASASASASAFLLRAEQALWASRPTVALDLLLTWWRSARHGAIAAAIARIAAAHPDPKDDVAANLPLVGLRIADAEKRARKLSRFDPDPRIADAAAALLLEMPFVSEGAKPLWTGVMELLPVHGDDRLITLAMDLPSRWKIRGAMQGWLANRLQDAMTALVNNVPGASLPADLLARLAALAPARAAQAKPGARDEASLLAAIYADPDDDAARLVYADLLLERGDPRGEFIALQCKKDPTLADQARIARLLKEHQDAWLGPLKPVLLKGVVFRRGFPAEGRVKFHDASGAAKYGSLPEWATFESLDYPALQTADDQKKYAQHVDPVMRHLREITGLGNHGMRNLLALDVTWRLESMEVALNAETAKLFLQSERLPALRRLKAWMPLDGLKSARWAPQLTHLRLVDMSEYEEMLPDAYEDFPALEELSATDGTSEGLAVTRVTRAELPRRAPGVARPVPGKKALTWYSALAWSADGTKLYVSAGPDYPDHLVIYDAATLREESRVELGDMVRCWSLSPDGTELLGGPENAGVTVWTLDGTRRLRLDGPGAGDVSRFSPRCVGWSQDGARFFAGGRSVEVYDRKGKELASFAASANAALSPDGARVAWVDFIGQNNPRGVKVRAVDGKRGVPLEGSDKLMTIAWTPGGFAGRTWRTHATLWDAGLEREVRRFELAGQGFALALSDDARSLAVGIDGAIQLFDTTGDSVHRVPAGAFTTALAYSPDRARLAFVERTKGPVVHDARSGEELARAAAAT